MSSFGTLFKVSTFGESHGLSFSIRDAAAVALLELDSVSIDIRVSEPLERC